MLDKAIFSKDKAKSLLYNFRTLLKHLKKRGYTNIELESHDDNFMTFTFERNEDA